MKTRLSRLIVGILLIMTYSCHALNKKQVLELRKRFGGIFKNGVVSRKSKANSSNQDREKTFVEHFNEGPPVDIKQEIEISQKEVLLGEKHGTAFITEMVHDSFVQEIDINCEDLEKLYHFWRILQNMNSDIQNYNSLVLRDSENSTDYKSRFLNAQKNFLEKNETFKKLNSWAFSRVLPRDIENEDFFLIAKKLMRKEFYFISNFFEINQKILKEKLEKEYQNKF